MLHDMKDQQAAMSSVLDLVRTASCDTDVRDHLRTVFAQWRSGRPRPAYLGIPLDLLARETQLVAERFAAGDQPHADRVSIERAAAMLHAAHRPMIIAGGGARGAARELR
jgi:thiamine pyrophosphate-dependent acetolactate synthase large subunit-like protein